MTKSRKIFVFFGILISTVLNISNGIVIFEKKNRLQSNSMLEEITRELLERPKNTNEILNLNLSNVLLLFLLKAVVFTAGFIRSHDYRSRKNYEETIISQNEITLASGYLMGDTCLYRAACEVPITAKEYLGAADLIMRASKLLALNSSANTLPFEKYEKMILEFRKAINYGITDQCTKKYSCKKDHINS